MRDLNQAIDDFDYGYSVLNDKQAQIKEVDLDLKSSSNLGQSASQMWSLACMLPLLLNGKVDCNDPHWTTLLCHLEIMGICVDQEVSFSSVINLKRLVKSI